MKELLCDDDVLLNIVVFIHRQYLITFFMQALCIIILY